MRSRPVLLKILRAPLGDQPDRQSRCVGRNNRPRLPHRFHSLKQLPLDLQILGHRLDDPVRFAAPRQVIVEISRRDQSRRLRRKKSRRPRLLRRFQSCADNPVPHRRIFQRQALSLFVGIQFRWDNIEQVARNSRIRQMRRDSRPHRSSAQHRRFFDLPSHRPRLWQGTWLQKR